MEDNQFSIENLCIGDLASVLYRQYQIYINRAMNPHHINSSEFMLLSKLDTQTPLSQSQISGMLFIDNAIVTRSLQSLEKKGVVTREKSQQDGRSTLVLLTSKGESIKKAGLEQRQRWKDTLLEGITPQQEKSIMALLQQMARQSLSITRHGSTL